jgi:GT2 family glycosyltransferase
MVDPRLSRLVRKIARLRSRTRTTSPVASPGPVEWPFNIRDLVDSHYVGLQVGSLFETRTEALQRVVSSRAHHAVTIHPLIEPAWMMGQTPRSVAQWLNALKTPGSVTQLGPLFSLAEAGQVDGEKPLDTFRRFIRQMKDDTELPTPDGSVVTWGEARDLLEHRTRLFAAQNLRTQRRARDDWDDDVEAAFRAELAAGPASTATTRSPDAGPFISVVMPAYNRAHVILAAVESVRRQTLTDWELVVVDDGSTDDTVEVVQRLADEDSRIRVVSQSKSGVSVARNAGIAASHGEIVAFIDSDNQWREDYLEVSASGMAHYGVPVTYTGIKRYEDHGRIQYVGVQAGRDYLLDGLSFIDLNVLMVRRDLLVAVGGFDESLRRWVDYDLVLRLMLDHDARYLPVIGVDYEHEEATVGRITTSERSTWREVVLSKYLVDWDAVDAGAAARVEGRISVLMNARNGWHQVLRAVQAVLSEADRDGLDVEVVLVDKASTRDFSAVIAAAFALEPRVVLVREANDRKPALSSDIAFALSTGSLVLVMSATAVGRRGWLGALVNGLVPDAAGAAAVVLDAEGTVGASGIVFAGDRTFPRSFLRGQPLEDLVRSGRRDFAAATASALLLRADDFRGARGFRSHFGGSLYDVDLCLRIGSGRPVFRLVTDAVLVDPALTDDSRLALDAEAASAFAEHWSHDLPEPDHETALERAGLQVAEWRVDTQVGLTPPARRLVRFSPLRESVPLLRRVPGAPRRWAVKISSPAAPRGDAWGDTFFAEDLRHALEAHGNEVVVDRVEGHFRRSRDIDDVVLTIRGLAKVPPQPGAVNVLWVISHPDLVSDDEIRSYDIVYAAGASWAARATERTGVSVRPLFQATNPSRFRPDVAVSSAREDVLFIGTPRKAMRPIVADTIAAGFVPAIYGHGWDGYVDPDLVKADFVHPDDVGAMYRGARVVLNDHWSDMARHGFLSNRLFDAVAAGARVISDEVPGLHEVFGDAVTTYQGKDDLRELLDGRRELPSNEALLAASAAVRSDHSFAARAARMDADVTDLLARRRALG